MVIGMKRTQRKDAIRNVRRQLVSWISIVVIAMLAVMAYLGLSFTSRAIARNGNRFYAATNFRDAEIISTLLLTEEDMDVIRETEGVAEVEGAYQANVIARVGGIEKDTVVLSLTERLNLPMVVEGRLPEKADECVLEPQLLESLGASVGDDITFTDSTGYLKSGTYKITGVILHPDHACSEIAVPGDRYAVVAPQAFDREALDGCFMRAEIRYADTAGLELRTKDYDEAAAATTARLEAMTEERARLRSDAIRSMYQERIDEAEKELADAEKELADARKELDDGHKEYEEGEAALKDAAAKLEEGRKTLEDGEAEYTASGEKLAAAETELAAAKAELENGKQEIEASKASVQDMLRTAAELYLGDAASDIVWSSVDAGPVDDPATRETLFPVANGVVIDLNLSMDQNAEAILGALGVDMDAAKDEAEQQAESLTPEETDALLDGLLAAKDSYDALADGAKKWDEGHDQYIAGLNDYNAGLAAYQNARAQLDYGWAELEANQTAYDDGVKDLGQAKKDLEKGEEEYADGLRKYEEGQAELEEAKADLKALNDCRWFVLDQEGNMGSFFLRNGTRNVKNISVAFALLFILVGAMVIYATVGRIVEEQRQLVGTTKALGLLNREILAKYMLFGVSGTAFGILLGFAGAYSIIQRIALNAYSRFYMFDCTGLEFQAGLAAIVAVLGILLSTLAVWSACTQLMKTTATTLMQGKAPSAAPKGGEGKRSGSLYNRLILRNIRTDRRRVLVTIASVAGCCALLVAGFTIRNSIAKGVDRQFADILKYDLKVFLDQGEADAEEQVRASLEEAGASFVPVRDTNLSFKIGERMSASEFIVGDLDDMDDFFALRDAYTRKPLDRSVHGVYIHRMLSEVNGVRTGDRIALYDEDMVPHIVVVAGVFEDYVCREMVMSTRSYEMIFGKAPKANVFLARLEGGDAAALKQSLEADRTVAKVDLREEVKRDYVKLASVLDLIAGVLTVIAAMMAYFILLNLVNMQIHQKKRELTIMRVNGFTVREVNGYVVREAVFTTIAGIVLGIAAGALLGYRVLTLVESVALHVVLTVQPLAWLLGAVIAAVFAVAIYALALRKIKDLKLTDVA